MINLKHNADKNGVPVISDAKIDTDVERLLRCFNPDLLRYPQPLDVESFAEDFLEFNLHYEYLSSNGCILGTMVFVNSQIPVYKPQLNRAEYAPIDENTIVIDNNIIDGGKEEIFRSSVGHECGHGVYHRGYFSQSHSAATHNDTPRGIPACRKSDILGLGTPTGRRVLKTPRDFLEHHAKYFSASLLMPASAIRIVCGEPSLQRVALEEGSDLANYFLAEKVAETFNVSARSAAIRVKQLKLGFDERLYN